ncbi:serine/threonine-protein kinase [Prochlorothrix hollandica]|uniref:serine/threonine-protein kinase n=1 Tax=Prochlorothrix hollandica TaxID=1223 RepID=UPI00034917CF|nr:serine/threonine-protein kinase [Prochlorothrix hollandica]
MNPIELGTLLANRYRVIQVLGQGGFGRTYLAEDLNRFQETCVLKEFAPQVQGPEALQKAQDLFQREAGVLYRLNHPQIPCFRELFQTHHGDRDYLLLVQDHVAGHTYWQLLADLPDQGQGFGEGEVRRLLEQLLPVLTYIHGNGVIHRDISPDNLILRTGDQLPVLIDFGGVKQVAVSVVSQYQSQSQSLMSGSLTRLGKVGYAPPEQMQQGSVYPHSDLYALGVTALVLLTGKEPQLLLDPQTLEWQWRQEVTVSETLGAVLDRMVQLRPSDRYSSATEVLAALTGQTQSLGQGQQPGPTPVLQPRTQATIAVGMNAAPDTMSEFFRDTRSPSPSPATATPAARRSPGAGALGTVLLFFGFLALAGLGGWGAVRLLQSLQTGNPSPQVTATPLAPTPPVAVLSPDEQRRKAALLKRQQTLGLDDRFFTALVNQDFFPRYPELQGQPLTSDPADADYREAWDTLAQTWLDRLERLKPAQRSRLGQYTPADFETWVTQVNDKYLSSRALADLTDVAFGQLFPEISLNETPPGPVDQLWWTVAEQVTDAVVGGEALEELKIKQGDITVTAEGTVSAGQGKAFIAQLEPGQAMRFDLTAADSLALALYPPTASGDPLVLPRSGQQTWEGVLFEGGYYEFVILPQGDRAEPYSLELTVTDPPPVLDLDVPATPNPNPTAGNGSSNGASQGNGKGKPPKDSPIDPPPTPEADPGNSPLPETLDPNPGIPNTQ